MIVDKSFIWSLNLLAPVNKDLGFDETRDRFSRINSDILVSAVPWTLEVGFEGYG
jgi:hypothetical protein